MPDAARQRSPFGLSGTCLVLLTWDLWDLSSSEEVDELFRDGVAGLGGLPAQSTVNQDPPDHVWAWA